MLDGFVDVNKPRSVKSLESVHASNSVHSSRPRSSVSQPPEPMEIDTVRGSAASVARTRAATNESLVSLSNAARVATELSKPGVAQPDLRKAVSGLKSQSDKLAAAHGAENSENPEAGAKSISTLQNQVRATLNGFIAKANRQLRNPHISVAEQQRLVGVRSFLVDARNQLHNHLDSYRTGFMKKIPVYIHLSEKPEPRPILQNPWVVAFLAGSATFIALAIIGSIADANRKPNVLVLHPAPRPLMYPPPQPQPMPAMQVPPPVQQPLPQVQPQSQAPAAQPQPHGPPPQVVVVFPNGLNPKQNNNSNNNN